MSVSVTFKGGPGVDAPRITIHAADLDDALKHITNTEMEELCHDVNHARR
jgi:hypothetical protein